MADEIKLTPKQKKFADLYVGECNLNATRAAIAAGYSEKTAYAIGSENLKKPVIRQYIDEQLAKTVASPSEVLSILTAQAKASIADVLDENGELDLKDAKKRGVDRLIKKLKVRKIRNTRTDEVETVYEYEIHDPQAAAVHLGKVHKLFTEKVEHSGSIGFNWADIARDAKDTGNLTDDDAA